MSPTPIYLVKKEIDVLPGPLSVFSRFMTEGPDTSHWALEVGDSCFHLDADGLFGDIKLKVEDLPEDMVMYRQQRGTTSFTEEEIKVKAENIIEFMAEEGHLGGKYMLLLQNCQDFVNRLWVEIVDDEPNPPKRDLLGYDYDPGSFHFRGAVPAIAETLFNVFFG